MGSYSPLRKMGKRIPKWLAQLSSHCVADLHQVFRIDSKQCTKQDNNLIFELSQINGLTSRAVSVAAGDNFLIACMENGEVYTWGEGGGGRLGHGDQKEQKEPTLVTALKGKNIIQVAAGESHALALSKEGDVFSWGSNLNSEIGIENVQMKCVPTALNSPNIVQITSVRSLYVWGQNTWGQLAQGHSRNVTNPTKVNNFPVSDSKILCLGMGITHSLFLGSSSPSSSFPFSSVSKFDMDVNYPQPPTEFYSPVEEGRLWCTGAVLGTGNEAGDDIFSLLFLLNALIDN